MKTNHLVMCVLLLAVFLVGGCVPAPTPPPFDAAPPIMTLTETVPVSTAAVKAPISIDTICAHKGERVEIQGILRLPDAMSCTKNEKPNWCTVQLYDPYYDKTLPVSFFISPSGMAANQMAAMPKSYGYADFKVQTGAGTLVGHGSLVSLTGKISSVEAATGGSNDAVCVLSDIQQVTALTQLTPLGIEVKKYDLAEAIASGTVAASISGNGLDQLNIKLKAQINLTMEIQIAPGTMFEALTGGVQNMVVRKAAMAVLRPNAELALKLDVACANMEKKQPTVSDQFKVSRAPVAQSLQKLVGLAEFSFASNRVQQFAVWTITDNPSPGSFVGIDTTNGASGAPTTVEIAEMRQLFNAAGIVLTPYKIFK